MTLLILLQSGPANVLLIPPLVLGTSRQPFPDGGAFAALRLVESRATPSRVGIVVYEAAEGAERVPVAVS